jgi:hypothetical protein
MFGLSLSVTLTVELPAACVNGRSRKRCPKSVECVTEPVRTSVTRWIASGEATLIWKLVPSVSWAGAVLMIGRAARWPLLLNR